MKDLTVRDALDLCAQVVVLLGLTDVDKFKGVGVGRPRLFQFLVFTLAPCAKDVWFFPGEVLYAGDANWQGKTL